MDVKYTRHFLNKLEDIFAETDYILRYEKGNFRSGYCIMKDARIAVVNKYFGIEGKINSLLDILRSIEVHVDSLSQNNRKLYFQIIQKELSF